MNRERVRQIEQLDRQVSCLQAAISELSTTENGSVDLSLLHRKSVLEKEMQQQGSLLQELLQGQPRPWYLYRLPPEMLVAIFQWITDPSDQLRLLQTFPLLGPLMNWDEGTLYFQQIYPLVAPYLWDDWKDIWRLCQVSPEYMHAILDHLKAQLSGSTSQDFLLPEYEGDLDDLVEECNELGRTDWMATMPFLVSTGLYGDADGGTRREDENGGLEIPGVREYIRTFLDDHGGKIWACDMVFSTRRLTENQAYETLYGILAKMPNLVSLDFTQFSLDIPNLDIHLPRRWPDLPNLRSLEAKENYFRLSLIRWYGPHLKCLRTAHRPPVPQAGVSFPFLEYYSTWTAHAFPEAMLEAPLKTVMLQTPEPGATREMLTIMNHFAESLEKLMLYYETTFERYMIDTLHLEAEWMSGMRLPKLRHLEVLCKVGSLDGLLALPSLQILRFHRDVDDASHGRLHLRHSPDDRTTLVTNVWDHLLNLKRMEICWEGDQIRYGRWVTYTAAN